MQFVRIVGLTAVLGFAWTSTLSAQRGAVRSGLVGPALTPGSSVLSTRFTPAPVGLNPPAASYTGIRPGALRSINGTRGSQDYSAGHRETSYHEGSNGTRGSRDYSAGHRETSYHESAYGRYGSRYYPGFVAPPLYLPTFVDPFFSSFGSYNDSAPPPVDPNAQALAESQNALAQQVEQLATQIQEMKNSNAQPQPPALNPTPVPSVSAAPEQRPPTPPVTLVLRDGQQLSVESYAVMNQMFWNFSKRPVQKIPIANIDIPASTKATEANGGEFPQLTSPQ
ncbi:MAG: hypothetical protein JO185_02480 [Acidobacteriaceae bacterium]|nr:hypothetical protein [Acidobacteriaceae bacterium]